MISQAEILGIENREQLLTVKVPITEEMNVFLETFILTYKDRFGGKVSKATAILLMMDRGHDSVKNQICETLEIIEKIKKLQQ